MKLDWGGSISRFKKHVKSTVNDVQSDIKGVVDRTGDEIINSAKRNTPVETGKLKNAWSSLKTGSGSSRVVNINNPTSYGPYIENGSLKRAPVRMLGKAVQRGKSTMKRRLKDAVGKNAAKFNRG